MFVKTDTILDQILTRKQADLYDIRHDLAFKALAEDYARQAAPPRDFTGALQRDTVALIAEVKKASPSKGLLVKDFNPVKIGRIYEENGAAAISVLTDEPFFQGTLGDMKAVRDAVRLPVLRKDFIIDAHQVYEARASHADAVLLIVMALEDQQMADLHGLICALGMAALVEVHNASEMERALRLGATLIGVNNRDLRTFHEDLTTIELLARDVPSNVTLVAESAIRSMADVQRMADCGARAVLVGEGLVKAADMGTQVRQFSSVRRTTGTT